MDRKLLLAVLKTHAVTIDNKAVAEELSKKGEELTANAVAKRITKIRAMDKEDDTGYVLFDNATLTQHQRLPAITGRTKAAMPHLPRLRRLPHPSVARVATALR